MKKVSKNVAIALVFAVYAWAILSFAEVIIKNKTPNPQYSPVNLFEIADKYIDPIW